jgi:23S rRNA pseudouridine1911/1915/1917 synthase
VIAINKLLARKSSNMSKRKKMDIIYEDKELLVINKPSGLLTVATEKEHINTLYHEAREYVKKQNPKNKIFIVHRLDKDTSGIVVFAKNEKLKFSLQNNWENVAKTREYYAILCGCPTKKTGRIENFLKESKTLQVYNTNKKDGKLAITDYEIIKNNKEYSLAKINILTGRKNQIRVAMSSINCPIAGDKKYNAKKNPYRRVCLHATKLVLIHPITHKEYIFLCPFPQIFDKIFEM